MNLAEIKEEIGLREDSILDFSESTTDSDWLQSYDHSRRRMVTLHKDTAKVVKTSNRLGVQEEDRTSGKGNNYRSYRIVEYSEPANIVASF